MINQTELSLAIVPTVESLIPHAKKTVEMTLEQAQFPVRSQAAWRVASAVMKSSNAQISKKHRHATVCRSVRNHLVRYEEDIL